MIPVLSEFITSIAYVFEFFLANQVAVLVSALVAVATYAILTHYQRRYEQMSQHR